MEQRLEFERNLRRREEQRKASGNSRKFKGEGASRDREGSVESNETMERERVEETDRWEEGKPVCGKTGDDEDQVRVGESTPTLSPETSESRDEEGKDEILGYNDTDMKQACVEAEMKRINEPFAAKEVGSDESHADDHEESSETDSVKEEKEPRRINWEMEQAKSSGGELEQLGQLDEEVQRHLSSWQEVQSPERNISGGMKACGNLESDRNGIEIVEGKGDGPEEDVSEQRQQESSSESEVEGSESGPRLSGKELETYGEEIENDGREERIESSSGALREKKKKAKKDKKVGKKSKRAKKEKKKKAKKDKKRTKKCNESEPQESALSSEDETKKKRKKKQKAKKKEAMSTSEADSGVEEKMKKLKKSKKAKRKMEDTDGSSSGPDSDAKDSKNQGKGSKTVKKLKKEKKLKKREKKENTSSGSERDTRLPNSKGYKQKCKKRSNSTDATGPLDLRKLRTMMKEKLISEKELRKLMKATVRSEKEKKVTFKISEFSRNDGKDLMKVLFSKRTPNEKNSTHKRQEKRGKSRSSSESSESEIRELASKKRRGHTYEEDTVEPSREPKKVLKRNEEKNRYKSYRETENVGKVKRNTAKTCANLSEVAISHERKNGVEDKFGKEKKPRSESRDKRRHSAERSEKKHHEEERESKRGERSCKRKKDGMLEVKVVNKKPVFDEGVVDDEKIGRKLMKRLLEKEGKRDMSQRLGPIPSRASKRAW